MSGSEKKAPSEGFTIQISQTNDSSEIPGVAELLGKTTTSRRMPTEPRESDSRTEMLQTKAMPLTMKSLKEFEVKIEIHFELRNSSYHFMQFDLLGSESFMGMEELLKGMKIPHQYFEKPFQEFNRETNSFWFGLLGVENEKYAQLVTSQESRLLTIFLSSKSMTAKTNEIVEYCESNYSKLIQPSIEVDIAS